MTKSNSVASNLLVSAYEAARLENIKKNAEMLKQLGIQLNSSAVESPNGKRKSPSSKTKPEAKPKVRRTATRSSARLRNEPAPGFEPALKQSSQLEGKVKESFDPSSYESRLMELKIERLRELHKENTTTYNSTATYEHTWMRIRTMTDKALLNRVRAIERALGQHCIVKMRMFAEVLILAGKEDLAENAQEALGRLLALAGDKQEGHPENKPLVHKLGNAAKPETPDVKVVTKTDD